MDWKSKLHAPALFAPNNKKNNINNDNVDNKFLCDSNILISKDKNFSNTTYKNLKRKIGSMDTLKSWSSKRLLQRLQILDLKISIIFRGF